MVLDTIITVGEFLLWRLWDVLYILWWQWPFYWLTWPLTVVTIMNARNEYKKSGGGALGLFKAIRFAISTLPSTTGKTIRFFANFGVLMIKTTTQTDPVEKMPVWLRNWLGFGSHPTIQVKEVVREVKVTKYRTSYRTRLKWFTLGFATAVIVSYTSQIWLPLIWATH